MRLDLWNGPVGHGARLLALGGALFVGCDHYSTGPDNDAPAAGSGGAAGGAAGGAGGNGGQAGSGGEAGSGGMGGDPGTGGVAGQGQYASLKPSPKYKDVYRLKADLSRALKIEPEALCKELGLYDCFDRIHLIALQGVEAYEANIYEAPEELGITIPMVIDRIMLSACAERIVRDTEGAEGAIFVDVELDGGRVADIDSDAIAQGINRLYTRAFLRQPTEEEIGHLKDLYRQIEASPDSEVPAYDWGVLACYSVLSSVEFLFY